MTMIIALAGMAVLLRGTMAMDLRTRDALNRPKKPNKAPPGGPGEPARRPPAPARPRNATAPAGLCMEGASLGESPTTPAAQAATGFVKHPTGLTFRTYILDRKPGLRQEERLKRGVWESTEQKFMVDAFRSDPNCTRPVFIDGGAAFGYYSLLAAFHSPCREVQAFNPHPRFAESMRLNIEDNVKANVLKAPKICINRLALAGREGVTKIDFGYAGQIQDLGRKPAAVRMTSLDAFAEKHMPSGRQILMVKLDIEGKEVEALQGARKLLQGCRVKFWAIGIHNQTQPVVDILRRNRYEIVSAPLRTNDPNLYVLARC